MRVRRGVLDTVVAAARAAGPRECCGILIGREDEIVEALPARNLDPDPDRFLIDPHDHIAARRAARNRGLDVRGFYHSHPHTAAVPSPRDLAEATYDNHLYLIVGLRADPPELRIYRLVGRQFEEVSFRSV